MTKCEKKIVKSFISTKNKKYFVSDINFLFINNIDNVDLSIFHFLSALNRFRYHEKRKMKVLIAGKLNVTNDFKFSRSGWSIILTGALLKIGVWLAP